MNNQGRRGPPDGLFPSGNGGWISVSGALPVHVRVLPEGEVHIWTRLRRPSDVRVLFAQIGTLLENRTEVNRSRAQRDAGPAGQREPSQYELFPGGGTRTADSLRAGDNLSIRRAG